MTSPPDAESVPEAPRGRAIYRRELQADVVVSIASVSEWNQTPAPLAQ